MKLVKMEIRKWIMMGSIAFLPLAASADMASTSASTQDDRIESSAKDSHVFKSYLQDDTISVDSQNGVVTLSGTVMSPSHKDLAQDTVENIDGVKRIDNKLFVKGDGMQGNSDKWIETKVKTALLFHSNVSGLKTEVTSKNGAVTLRGTADSAASKDLAAEYAKDIDGVKSVNNELIVQNNAVPQQSMGEKIDDASITAQVKAVLLYHRSTSAIKTKVKTTDGVVMLSGTAKNAAEKDLVAKLVKDVKGVKDVQNNITVAPGANG